jgi:hypothetical protein
MLKQLIKEDSRNGMTEKVFKIRHAIMYFNHRFCTFCNFLDIHRYLSKIDCSRHISLKKKSISTRPSARIGYKRGSH